MQCTTTSSSRPGAQTSSAKRRSPVCVAKRAPFVVAADPGPAATRPVLSTVVFDCSDPERLAQFWGELLGVGVAYRDSTWVALERTPEGGRIAFQPVPEPKSGKNRLHVDLLVVDLAARTADAVAIGATIVGSVVEEDNGSFQVLRDPEGNEFCLVTADD
jgi:predicted enzyme related to lactoylglutathione lyase